VKPSRDFNDDDVVVVVVRGGDDIVVIGSIEKSDFEKAQSGA
jgi:hypothetical protein